MRQWFDWTNVFGSVNTHLPSYIRYNTTAVPLAYLLCLLFTTAVVDLVLERMVSVNHSSGGDLGQCSLDMTQSSLVRVVPLHRN